uniref:NADH dehydrogenase [ubiquinone] 1 alpha subcomplex subunit 12 n=1 Tax=Odontella aurita TaxID=265563 RepID=A0A7S4N733_9STRA|eukprot:CAMPEP_0113538914 /NCGR_PEP_ID=MMETSP0015_2-20120614/7631_1 /TAXON_ID=2838 /ORGANISM="Odontella" /LENGTH=247 /DNA_ID=CAMNT_0000438543 /DNA_START=28 /DNA_END=771 /DNA_ORIENTATION=+ /assembly_acc=CAM_ASM_000160
MVWGLVQSFKAAAKYRGGWRGLLEHMYTNGDYPFKFGTYMGCDAGGNRYYENRVDYPFGQHRWVEPGDIHNFDSSSISPEWQCWMTSMNDVPPSQEEAFIESKMAAVPSMCRSDAPVSTNVGHQQQTYNFHHLHNLSQVRSRGYNIGNPIVGLPPGVKDSYYTQPGSPYNDASIEERVPIGDLDEATGGGRPFKSDKWKERLRTSEEKAAIAAAQEAEAKRTLDAAQAAQKGRIAAMRGRGAGTVRP